MAKIEELDIDTIKIDNAALTGTVESSFEYNSQTGANTNASVTVPDTYGNPVVLIWNCPGWVGGGSLSVGGGATLTFNIRRGTTVIYTQTQSASAGNSYDLAWGGSFLDKSPGVAPNYNTTHTKSTGGGGAAARCEGTLVATYIKK